MEIGTQQDLAQQLESRGMEATQSSVSRDIRELGLIKVSGRYAAPGLGNFPGGDIEKIDTAGDNLIVVRTGVGSAQSIAIKIDRADIPEIVGTVAGDDTIIIAVKSGATQRVAVRKITQLLASPHQVERRRRSSSTVSAGRAWV